MSESTKPKRGRPAMLPQDRKPKVTLRLSPDVLALLRASGDGWQTRADDILREALGLVFDHTTPFTKALPERDHR